MRLHQHYCTLKCKIVPTLFYFKVWHCTNTILPQSVRLHKHYFSSASHPSLVFRFSYINFIVTHLSFLWSLPSYNWLTFVGWLLELHVPETFNVMSAQVPTCGRTLWWRLVNVAPLGDQTASTMIWYPSQLHSRNLSKTGNRCLIDSEIPSDQG